MAAPFKAVPPPLLQPGIARFDGAGRPTIAQVQYEQALQQYLTRLVGALGTLQAKTDASAIPTSNPHVAGQIWSNGGVLTVSAG